MIGSDRYVTVSGKPVLGRKTKWGLIEGEKKLFEIFTQALLFYHLDNVMYFFLILFTYNLFTSVFVYFL